MSLEDVGLLEEPLFALISMEHLLLSVLAGLLPNAREPQGFALSIVLAPPYANLTAPTEGGGGRTNVESWGKCP